MVTSFYKLIEDDIREKYKGTNIVIWYDLKGEFRDEYKMIDIEGVNKTAYDGSFIELRYNIFKRDKELTQKWLIYINHLDDHGFLTEYEFFGEIYTVSVKSILEKNYNVDFGKFDLSTIDERLNVLKRLWDIIPENTVKYLDQETLDGIVLTNGFGYVDINKGYTVLKYICETDKYDAVLEESKIKNKFFEFLLEEYGIYIDRNYSKAKTVEVITNTLFQSELIQKNRNKSIRPFGVDIANANKTMNCVQLLETWANHELYKDKFVEYSKKMSEKYMLNVLNTVNTNDLFGIEYLYGVEDVLYKKLQVEVVLKEKKPDKIKEILINGLKNEPDIFYDDKNTFEYSSSLDLDDLKNDLKDLKVFVDVRRRYYFSKAKIFNKWGVLYNIFCLLELIYSFKEQTKKSETSFENIVKNYEEENWWRIDYLYRKIQEDLKCFDGFITKLFNLVDKKYHYDYLKPLNEQVADIIDVKGRYEFEINPQIDFWSQYVSDCQGKVAVVIVDALRYEMGKDLMSLLNDIDNIKIYPIISSLPSITEYGMASLLPNDNTKLKIDVENKGVGIFSGYDGSPLNNKNDRIKYFMGQSGEIGIVKGLDDIISMPINNLNSELKGKERILVFSGEIDEAGHIEDSSIQMFPSLLQKIALCIRKLAEIDINRIVVVSDHGFLLTSGLQDWAKVDLDNGLDVLAKKRRYSVTSKKREGNFITKTCYSLNYNGQVFFNFPRGINVFSEVGGTKFYHGGISLQETLVPVIVIDRKIEQKPIVKDNDLNTEQISMEDLALKNPSIKFKTNEVPKTIKEQIRSYIDNSDLSKKEETVLELFLKASSYTDAEIQEICLDQGTKFITKSVMKFMDDLIDKLKGEEHDWIGFRVVGLSTYEYFLK